MASLWSATGDGLTIGYTNLQAAKCKTEKVLNEELDAMWAKFEPYADPGFIGQFAQDPDAHFWEMYLGFCLLEAGKTLLNAAERQGAAGLPDICVIEGGRRHWIEAIAPDKGDAGPNQVVGPKPINEGGGMAATPVRQAQLRMTSALWDKSQVIQGYVDEGTIKAEDAPHRHRSGSIRTLRFRRPSNDHLGRFSDRG